jgi:hypothetical protein
VVHNAVEGVALGGGEVRNQKELGVPYQKLLGGHGAVADVGGAQDRSAAMGGRAAKGIRKRIAEAHADDRIARPRPRTDQIQTFSSEADEGFAVVVGGAGGRWRGGKARQGYGQAASG